jgi:Uma2 family endonuclease
MVAEKQREGITVEEWRALERASHDAKHEYVDGYLYAMAGGTRAHGRIAFNAASLLESLLGNGPCTVYTSDVAARVSANRFVYPDAYVTCAESDQPTVDETEVLEPRVVIEVLSESTERFDRSLKFAYYRDCPSVLEYVLVNTDYQAVEVYRRTEGQWGTFHVYRPGDDVELTSIDARFPVAALYRRTDVPETPPDVPLSVGSDPPPAGDLV